MTDHHASVTRLDPKKMMTRCPLAVSSIDGYGRFDCLGQSNPRLRAGRISIVST